MTEVARREIQLVPLAELDSAAWRRVQSYFRDPEISHLNGTAPSKLPVWLLRPLLKADSRRNDRRLYGVIADGKEFIGLTELYDIRDGSATLGIIIGERAYWGRGYGTETVRRVLDIAFNEVGLDSVRLSTFEDNLRAQASFRKAGFRELQRVAQRGDKGRMSVWMSIPRERWFSEFRSPLPQKNP